MPCLQVFVNVKISDEQKKSLLTKLTAAINQTTGKPKAYIMVLIQDNHCMSFADTTEPCALMDFRSIGCIDRSKNKKHSATFSKILSDELNIPVNRIYISFANAPAENWGYDGDTFA